MRAVPKRKIMRSVCKTCKNDSGIIWVKVVKELKKLSYFKKITNGN